MEVLVCILAGYLLGGLNPAALLAKKKQVDLKENGTGNLGATNTFMVIGRGYGILVMILDIIKGFLAVKLMELLFPRYVLAGLIGGVSAVVGHVFPIYMGFKGGKGLAAFAGLILASDPVLFLILLVVCMALMLIIDYAVVLPISATLLYPVVAALHHYDPAAWLLVLGVSILVFCTNWKSLRKVLNGEEIRFREYFKKSAT